MSWQADTPKQVPEHAPPLLDVSPALLCAGQNQHASVGNSLAHVLVLHGAGCIFVTTVGVWVVAVGLGVAQRSDGWVFGGFYHDQPSLVENP